MSILGGIVLRLSVNLKVGGSVLTKQIVLTALDGDVFVALQEVRVHYDMSSREAFN